MHSHSPPVICLLFSCLLNNCIIEYSEYCAVSCHFVCCVVSCCGEIYLNTPLSSDHGTEDTMFIHSKQLSAVDMPC